MVKASFRERLEALKDMAESPEFKASYRAKLFGPRNRILCTCLKCNYLFPLFKKGFDFTAAIKCPKCQATDEQDAIKMATTAMEANKWSEGYFIQERHHPGPNTAGQEVRVPFWFYDYVAPHLTRFELIVMHLILRFKGPEGKAHVSQRKLAERMAGFELVPDLESGEGVVSKLHIPARQNVSHAVAKLARVQVIYKLNDGREVAQNILLREQVDGRSYAMRPRLDIPEGAAIDRVQVI